MLRKCSLWDVARSDGDRSIGKAESNELVLISFDAS